MMEFAPAALRELPSKIEPHEQQEGRLQVGNQTEELVMPLPNFRDQFTHDF